MLSVYSNLDTQELKAADRWAELRPEYLYAMLRQKDEKMFPSRTPSCGGDLPGLGRGD
jgi:hypothetical protein